MNRLIEEIEKERTILNEKFLEFGLTEETLEMSQSLDRLIIEYMEFANTEKD